MTLRLLIQPTSSGKARAGLIAEFTGISAPYEAPKNPELTVNTSMTGLEDCVWQVIREIERRGIVSGAAP